VLSGIKGTADDGSGVSSIDKIAAAATHAIAAQAKIASYAADPLTHDAPTASDYRDLGIEGATNLDQISALNSALKTGIAAGTPADVQKAADAFTHEVCRTLNSVDYFLHSVASLVH